MDLFIDKYKTKIINSALGSYSCSCSYSYSYSTLMTDILKFCLVRHIQWWNGDTCNGYELESGS